MGVVIRRWVWLESIGVVSGCFPHITYISLLHLYLFFFAAHLASLLLFSFYIYIYTCFLSFPLECIVVCTKWRTVDEAFDLFYQYC